MKGRKKLIQQKDNRFPKRRGAVNADNGTGLSRRGFISGAAAALAISTTACNGPDMAKSTGGAGSQTRGTAKSTSKRKFKLKYAPHPRMFKLHVNEDPIEEIKFMADQGFTAMEDNLMMRRPKEFQEKVASLMSRLGMTMGVFIAYSQGKKTFVSSDNSIRDMLVQKMKAAVEVAKRVNAKWVTVIPGGYDEAVEWNYQTANVIENLKWCADACEPSGLVMVLEPLNAWTNHPGRFLTRIPQAYQICRAVASPSCKILDDLYHQQVTEGNLIPNIDMAWEEIAYIQVGDNPGRNEPNTGEINYKNIFKHLYEKGYKGVVGMEHGKSKPGIEGERAVIEAYRFCDDF